MNDELTFEKQEEQKRFRAIKKNNSNLHTTEKFNICFKKGDMYVENQKYSKRVLHPTVTDLVESKSEEKITKLYQTEGEFIKNGKCRFVAISQEVTSLDDVRCGYVKARRKHPNALHMVCAYNLPGSHITYDKDYQENGETGAGKHLLQLLTNHNILHHAVYVAHYYGGERVGPTHFQTYIEAASSAIQRSSYNSIVHKNQFPFGPNLGANSRTRNPASVSKRDSSNAGYVKAASPILFPPHKVTTPVPSPTS